MMFGMSIGVIIPMKNELGNVSKMISICSEIDEFEQIIFIDGNSKDGTFNSLTDESKKLNDFRITILAQKMPFGKFEAIKQAHSHLKTKHTLIWDGDNTISEHDVKHVIHEYFRILKIKPCIVVANRLNKKMQKNSMKITNIIGNHLFSLLMVIILRKRVPDVLSGVKIFPSVLLESGLQCDFSRSFDKYGDISILALSKKLELDIISIRCEYKARTYGKTNINKIIASTNLLRLIFHFWIHKCFR